MMVLKCIGVQLVKGPAGIIQALRDIYPRLRVYDCSSGNPGDPSGKTIPSPGNLPRFRGKHPALRGKHLAWGLSLTPRISAG